MRHTSRQYLLTIVSLAVLCRFSALAGPALSSSSQHRLPSRSGNAEFNRLLFAGAVYMIDDGSAEDSTGFLSGGDLICLNEFAVIRGYETIYNVSLAWGSPVFPDPTLNGLPYTAILWSDPNGDGSPTDAVVLATASGVIANEGTDTFITTDFPPTTIPTANFFVGFFISQGANQFPAAFDQTAPSYSNRSYVAGGTMGDFYDLNDNDLPVAPTDSYGLVGNWLIRADTVGLLVVQSVVSSKAHGDRGTFEIPLPADGLGIEDRDTPIDFIVFKIGAELTSLDSASTSCGTLVYAATAGHDVLVEIDATQCDGQVITATINGVHDQLGNYLPSASANYRKLIGDVDGNGVVNFADAAAVSAARRQKTTAENFRLDVNADGSVNRPDYGIVKDSRRHSLPWASTGH